MDTEPTATTGEELAAEKLLTPNELRGAALSLRELYRTGVIRWQTIRQVIGD